MGKRYGLNDRKFLAGVLVAYFFVFFFSYFYFMAAGPLIIGNVIAGVPNISSSLSGDPVLIKTITILGIIVFIALFVFFVPTMIHKKRIKKENVHSKRKHYKPFKH